MFLYSNQPKIPMEVVAVVAVSIVKEKFTVVKKQSKRKGTFLYVKT